jgi:coenzyme F420-0:L-glutamate ligase/coenzyme F420-1:gamma-L-glutamate ligase
MTRATLIAIPGIPDVRPGMPVPAVLVRAIQEAGLRPHAGDVLVVAQKTVSKAEGSIVDLAEVVPG